MTRPATTCFIVAVLMGTLAASALPGAQVTIGGKTFRLPDGFALEQVAGPPLVDRPITADFDEQGRLYVADSSGSNEPVAVQVKKKPHRIVRLEDVDGDGTFDRRTIFADGMMFPEGTMWFDGSLYVSAPPTLWKLTDTDGDGVADRREEWVTQTLTNCANDLHGPYRGPDGWIYWCKGAFARQTYERPGKSPLVTRAAHIYRRHPDSPFVEPVMTGGMANPVDVVFTPGGERIFSTTFLQRPANGRRDGLIHAIYGGLYGIDSDVLIDHPHTGEGVMPNLVHLGPAAPCGLARLESATFGSDYRDSVFVTEFNMQKVSRHVLTPLGGSFQSRDEDFLVCNDVDFHPTDVIEDADGSLVVLDTGGWYKLCCPTTQLRKPDVLGAVYRIRRQGAPRVADARGEAIRWQSLTPDELTRLLDDRRTAVRERAIQTLGRRGDAAVDALAAAVRNGPSPLARTSAVWAATRIDLPRARLAARRALDDADEIVRQAAIHSAAVRRDREALPRLVAILQSPSAQNRRAAAEALGRIGDAAAIPALLDAIDAHADRAVAHSLTFALIEINDPKATARGLASASVAARKAALIALCEMESRALEPDTVIQLTSSTEPALKETAYWVLTRHPEWGDAVSSFFRAGIARIDRDTPKNRQELQGLLAQFSKTPALQQAIGDGLNAEQSSRAVRETLLRAVGRSGQKAPVPPAWLTGISRALRSPDTELVRVAIATAKALPLPKQGASDVHSALRDAAERADLDPADRLAALAALPGGVGAIGPPLFTLVSGQLASDRPAAVRTAAADLLGKARLSHEQLEAVIESVGQAGPLEIGRLIAAFDSVSDPALGTSLLAAIERAPGRGSLRESTLKPHLKSFGAEFQGRAAATYRRLEADHAAQHARVEELASVVAQGDVRRGQLVFNSSKAACSTCHAIGYKGGRVGPDLTRIGRIRTERDLLESIAFPSASFVQSFEPMTVLTKDGRVFSGLVRRDGAEEIVLATSATDEARIARSDVEEIKPGTVSVMPAGLDQQLSKEELADLVSFLKACQ